MKSMIIGIAKETVEYEARVAQTPQTVKKLIDLGFSVQITQDAGLKASYRDAEYLEAGAKIMGSNPETFSTCDVLLKVAKPSAEEMKSIREATIVIGMFQARFDPDLALALKDKKIVGFSLDAIPRIARAQKMDVLSSQSNVAGYKAVLLAANRLDRLMPLMMTAAGTIPPAKVLVIGAGVAGLQAIATARRLGAVVEAFDTRPAVKDQVESLGGKFLELAIEDDTEDQAGYAKELSQESHSKEEALLRKHSALADVVITTALIPGKTAPLLITKEMVEAMKPGSVIVDLAAELGGNCAVTEKDKEISHNGVIVIGHTNLPSFLAHHASALLSRNVLAFVEELHADKRMDIDSEDEVIRLARFA